MSWFCPEGTLGIDSGADSVCARYRRSWGQVEPCLRAGGFWLVSENRRGRNINQGRMARQPEPGMCQGLLGLVAACPARRALPARGGEALASRGKQTLRLAATAALRPHPKFCGCWTPNIFLPEHPWQGCSPQPRGQRLCHQILPEAGQGGGKMSRFGG